MPNCNLCKRELDVKDDLESRDCGGDCLKCMADAGDPDCVKALDDLVYRLRKRAAIRRGIKSRRSVRDGEPDRLADLLDEAAREIEGLRGEKKHRVLLNSDYGGFESINDLAQEFSEAQESYGFLGAAGIPNEYQGTLHVLVTYEEYDADKN